MEINFVLGDTDRFFNSFVTLCHLHVQLGSVQEMEMSKGKIVFARFERCIATHDVISFYGISILFVQDIKITSRPRSTANDS